MTSAKNRTSSRRFATFILWRVVPSTVAVMLAAGVVALLLTRNMVHEAVREHLEHVAESKRELVVDRINSVQEQARLLAGNDLIVNGLIDTLERDRYLPLFFQSLDMGGGVHARIALLDFQGREIIANQGHCSDVSLAGPRQRPMHPEGLLELGREGMFVSAPIRIHGAHEGAVTIALCLEHLKDLLILDDAERDLALLDHAGEAFLANAGYWERFGLAAPEADSQRLHVVRPLLPDLGVDLLVGLERDRAMASVTQLRRSMLAVGLVSILALIATVTVSARRPARTVEDLEAAVRGIVSHADLGRRVVPSGPRELRQLAAAFNQTLDSLERTTTSRDALRRSETRYRTLVEHLPQSIFIKDTELNYLSCNEKFAQDLKMSPDQVAGKNDRDLFPAWLAEAYRRDDRAVMDSGQRKEIQEQFVHEGRQSWVFTIKVPFRDEQGRIVGVLGLFSDITEQKQDQDALRRSEAELRTINRKLEAAVRKADQASQAKGLFLANMSHEIRTPMNAILGFAYILERSGTLADDQADHVKTIVRNGEHLQRLIDDILDMSKIEAGRVVQTIEEFCLASLLEEVEALFRVRCQDKGLRLEVEHAPDMPRHVAADQGKLRQILINLLGNAVKFTSQGRVVLRARAAAPAGDQTGTLPAEDGHLSALTLVIEVEDTGPGIPADKQRAIFDAFSQAEDGAKAGGTGLGLAISRKFARIMDGKLTVTSQEGQGSCFRLEVPARLARGEPAPRPARPRPLRLLPGQGDIRVLVVDDNPDNCSLLTALLVPLGFEVREAGNGAEALDVFARWSPQAVLLDMRMPVMDGYEAAWRIKADDRGRETLVVAVTASAFEQSRREVMAVGVDAYLRKPIVPDELLELLGERLGLEYVLADQDKDIPEGEPAQPGQQVPAPLPRESVASLREALDDGDMSRFLELIDELARQDRPSAEVLRRLAERYDYDSLHKLLTSEEEEKHA